MTYGVVFLLLILPMMPENIRVALICVQLGITLFSFIMYARFYRRAWVSMKKKA